VNNRFASLRIPKVKNPPGRFFRDTTLPKANPDAIETTRAQTGKTNGAKSGAKTEEDRMSA
jgi:hypothetical protein